MKLPNLLAVLTGLGSLVQASTFYKGHDLSSLKMLEDSGYTFETTAGKSADVEDILGDGGMNTVRLRLWVNPTGGVYGLDYNLELAKRFYKEGYYIYIDFHFSDTWADPSKQYIPSAWPTKLSKLESTLRSYVKSTLVSFDDAGVDVAIVSLGNEIRNGMLWPTGRVDIDLAESARVANFSNFANLWHYARLGVSDAVSAGVSSPKVMIHLDDGWSSSIQTTWYSTLVETGIVTTDDWDVIGVSFYPFYGTSATFSNLKKTLNKLGTTYSKPMMVVETDWPYECSGVTLSESSIAISAAGQTTWVQDIETLMKALSNSLGQGVFYWEPAFMNDSSLGSSCSDNLLFTADWSGWPDVVSTARSSVNMFSS